ncbi:eukaryotic translation initiation factor 5 [Bradysia coprophila]|uniref:eukaryotic translation initiation factor 5 n=1 Tax=Bradysia coprophila TaxID=38358 RepID=UPI00187DBD97|nr:eukaryotic translation initiation factor 5 [Bradysia coprophila]XP_037026170.1 eukaryotic translation initiation factor 5 [Bradysia coprophila]XP_037026177.1 eukaryotic translation initiation factor 5 [Bradysia coprophila]XP_037026185.1 eukaryotic translation initiation factor 5 [Bradysia coprophila]
MGTLNVNRNVTDVFYRYKMPRITAKVEGKGNGIKTVIVNMAEVAKAIGRPATYPTKYFGCELGAQTQFDYKNERFIVNGSHDATKLQDLLDGFIRKYVLCPECDNPETELLVAKKGSISQGCKACGFHGPLEVHHKVNTFIIKNPPTLNPAVQGSSLTEGKRSKRSKKGAENGGDSANTTANEGDISAADADIQVPKVVAEEEDDDATWSTDISEAAVRARMQDLTEGAKTMTVSDDADKSEKERMDIFYELVKRRRDGNELENVQVHKELAVEADRLDITQKAPLVLAELLFTQNIPNEVKKHRNLLLRFTHNCLKAQRYLIGGLEQIIFLHSSKLLDKVAAIFKLFYDHDILEEKALLEWASKVSKKYVSKEFAEKIHEKAKPFINWLQEAEEEESTDDDDSEVEIEYNDRVRIQPLRKEEEKAKDSKKMQDDDDGDEIDIDDI